MSLCKPPLPYLTEEIPGIPGRLRTEPEDFVVDEIPAYAPSGEGAHLFVRFRKRGLTTPEAVRRLASALSVDAREAGWAGLKDRHAVTTQWASFFGATEEAARLVTIPGVTVLEAAHHPHKLRAGHVRGNRFVLTLRDAGTELARAQDVLCRLAERGIPNYFGEQRFGRDAENVPRARRWLFEGGRAPRQRFERKLLVSALQSALFNQALAARITDRLFDVPVAGDLMRREDSGGLFVAPDPHEVIARLRGWEISPTGPMFGPKMRWPEGEAALREEAVLRDEGIARADLDRLGRLGEGTRRPLRVRPRDPTLHADGQSLVLSFELPSGAYATALTREILKEHQQ